MSQMKIISHTLAIKYGRVTRPKTKIEHYNSSTCHVPEDERHFIMEYTINQPESIHVNELFSMEWGLCHYRDLCHAIFLTIVCILLLVVV